LLTFQYLCFSPDNVKALYRRGRAYVSLCEGEKARADLTKCSALDQTTAGGCEKLLSSLSLQEKKHQEKDKNVYSKLFGK